MRYLLLIILSSCASNQSAFPVAPPITNPWLAPPSSIIDAPHTTGQPGTARQAYPRGEDKRVLPETPETRREPGIWATSGSRTVPVLDVAVPSPMPSETGANMVAMCAGLVEDGIRDVVSGKERYQRLSHADKQCFVANALWDCLRVGRSEAAAHRRSEAIVRDYDAAIALMLQHAGVACNGAIPPSVDELLRLWGIAFATPQPNPRVRH